ncbi:hypothetical protein [Flammeovirga sp. EKP202]|uniref:hypothetical protein n=1 Tax=Flammeovirga sp. EKP202 TaxID=2770592 RepID=UPI00165FC50B|nr:hypothetical protein [Flammeovirga sp. EKP202]MBD0400589.1 hypothetical protein [Flammeovirga sp. EKP202]
MKFYSLLFLFFLVFQWSYAQNVIRENQSHPTSSDSTTQYDPDYFVLGTLSDYMGRFQYVDRQKQIDKYYPYEKPLVEFLTQYIKEERNITVDTVFLSSNHSNMFSEELSKTMNSFYDDKDQLIRSKFKTNKQIYSFLAGVYYRYGKKIDDSIYKIQLANSPKHQDCYEFLKLVKCEKVFYKFLNNIPAQYILYFEPTKELKMYLDLIEPERIILQKSYHAQIGELMKGHMTEEELELDYQKSMESEAKKLKNVFE